MAKKIKKIPEDHPFYHDTWKLLKNYRDVAWNLELSNLDLQAEFRAEFGSSDHKSVDILTSAGSEITNTRLESFERSLQRSRKMMNPLDSAIQLMRSHHKKGSCIIGFSTTPIFPRRSTQTTGRSYTLWKCTFHPCLGARIIPIARRLFPL